MNRQEYQTPQIWMIEVEELICSSQDPTDDNKWTHIV